MSKTKKIKHVEYYYFCINLVTILLIQCPLFSGLCVENQNSNEQSGFNQFVNERVVQPLSNLNSQSNNVENQKTGECQLCGSTVEGLGSKKKILEGLSQKCIESICNKPLELNNSLFQYNMNVSMIAAGNKYFRTDPDHLPNQEYAKKLGELYKYKSELNKLQRKSLEEMLKNPKTNFQNSILTLQNFYSLKSDGLKVIKDSNGDLSTFKLSQEEICNKVAVELKKTPKYQSASIDDLKRALKSFLQIYEELENRSARIKYLPTRVYIQELFPDMSEKDAVESFLKNYFQIRTELEKGVSENKLDPNVVQFLNGSNFLLIDTYEDALEMEKKGQLTDHILEIMASHLVGVSFFQRVASLDKENPFNKDLGIKFDESTDIIQKHGGAESILKRFDEKSMQREIDEINFCYVVSMLNPIYLPRKEELKKFSAEFDTLKMDAFEAYSKYLSNQTKTFIKSKVSSLTFKSMPAAEDILNEMTKGLEGAIKMAKWKLETNKSLKNSYLMNVSNINYISNLFSETNTPGSKEYNLLIGGSENSVCGSFIYPPNSDEASFSIDSIKISPSSVQSENPRNFRLFVIFHEIGHWFNHVMDLEGTSKESLNKKEQVRNCLSKQHKEELSPKMIEHMSERISQGDMEYPYNEEDHADQISFIILKDLVQKKKIKKEMNPLCGMQDAEYEEDGQIKYGNSKIANPFKDTHSSSLFRLLHSEFNLNENKLSKECKELVRELENQAPQFQLCGQI